MEGFSISEALGVGFGLIGRKPLAVLAWGLLPVVVFVPLVLLFAGTLLRIIALASQAGGDQAAMGAAIASGIGGLLLFILLAILAGWVVNAMLYAAAFRAVLHPEQSSFAYLRFGGEELWLMAVTFVMGLVFFGVGLAFSIPQSIISLAMYASSLEARVAVLVILTLARLFVTAWIWLRLSMALPMTFAHRRFQLFESWALTRGHTLALLGFCVLAFLVLAGVEIVAALVGVAGGFAFAGGAIAAWRSDPQSFLGHPQAAIAALGGAIALWSALLVVVSGISTAVFRAPFAHIFRRLAGEDVAQTFT